ncbi:orotate phosphoribosyltransferase [Candidatus Woesearchaeota archaeon]|nr:orotate phosphoribosyltransferase [Candidatus Woesearchaeota archaeon]
MVNFGEELAKTALKIGAIKLDPLHPFLWASGYYMPIYNDNRMLLQDPKYRELIAEGFVSKIEAQNIHFDVIAGTATAGIPHATTLADRLSKPLIYIRDKPKDHGLRNQIEGIDSGSTLEGKTVLIIEDLISTGGSSLKAVQAVRNSRGIVKNMLSIFSYCFKETENGFRDADVDLTSLLTYNVLLEQAIVEGKIKQAEFDVLKGWREDYFNWGEKRGFPKGVKKSFAEKWRETVSIKESILCAGLDPAEYGQRADSIPHGISKLEWCLNFIEKVAPFSAAVKPNRNYIKDLSRGETKRLVSRIHELGMVAIDDSKLVDIGETNDSGLYHAQEEGFDAVTYSGFPGNTREVIEQAHPRGIGVIPLVLMSNKEFEPIKNSRIRGLKGYEYFALHAAEYGADAIVVGAPSPTNHIKDSEVRRVKEIVDDTLVLMPGVGAQGGDAKYIIEVFGRDNVIANVGRAIMYSHNPSGEAAKYKKMLNELRIIA